MPDIKINTDSSSVAERLAKKRKSKQPLWVLLGASGAVLLGGGLIAWTLFGGGDEIAEQPQSPKDTVSPSAQGRSQTDGATQAAGNAEEAPGTNLIADDGQTMWVSPTSGEPLDLAYLPMGCQMFVVLRPAELLASGEGEKILAALGPLGKRGAEWLEQAAGLPSDKIERVAIGVRPGSNFQPVVAIVVTPTAGARPPSGAYQPAGSESFVIAAGDMLAEIRELAGTPPALRRELESLLAQTDNSRHITIIAAPNFLFNDGRRMWNGPLAGLRDPLFSLLPDSTRAAALSLHWGDDFFAEVRLAATIDQNPRGFAQQFADKVGRWPAAAERTLAGIRVSPHSQTVVARLPAMLRVLNRYVRVGTDDDQPLLRAYLPTSAGHNLLTAGELLLAEQLSGGTTAAAALPTAGPAQSLDQRLAGITSLSFARDTLETAVKLLGEDIDVEIEIAGGDLQLDGITKNQSFGLDEQQRPAREILVAILRLANPDKTATSATDPKQKLVYVVAGDKIVVTTRAAAKKRGDKLPAEFTQ